MTKKESPGSGSASILLNAAILGSIILFCLVAPGYGDVNNFVGFSYSNINKLPAGGANSNLLTAQFIPDTEATLLKFLTPPRTIITGIPSMISVGNSITVEVRDRLGNRVSTYSGTITITSSSAQGRFSRDGAVWSSSGDSVFTVVSGSVSFYYRDTLEGSPTLTALHSLLLSDSQVESVLIDSTPPQGSVRINNDAIYGNTVAVVLNLSAFDTQVNVDTVVISNDIAFINPSIFIYGPAIAWKLLDSEGVNSVYVKFVDTVGNTSSIFSDTIFLDFTPPSGTITIKTDTDSVYAYSSNVVISVNAVDTLTAVDTMVISNYSDFSISSTYTYSNTVPWMLLPGDGIRRVYARFMDSAGNFSLVCSDTIVQVVGTINGTVYETNPYDTAAHYQPVNGVIVDVLKDTVIIASTTTSPPYDGMFEFTDLESGTYTVRVTYSPYDIISTVSSDIRTGTIGATYTLSITYKLGEIRGYVAGVKPGISQFKSGRRIFLAESEGIVELSQRGRVVVRVPADALGNYSIPNLLPGTFVARAFNGYIWSNPVKVRLREGEILVLNFTFEALPEEKVINYPNPVINGATTIEFQCNFSNPELEIRIYNIAGELVKTVKQTDISGGPIYKYDWFCKNDSGEKVASGVYLYQVIATEKATGERRTVIKKLMIIR